MPKETLTTAIRMIGHLVEHHGCTGAAARNKYGTPTGLLGTKACSWCVIGAAYEVGKKTGFSTNDLDQVIDDHLEHDWFKKWERGTNQDRLDIARTLQRYTE